MDRETIWEYATTTDYVRAQALLYSIHSVFLEAYDQEFAAYADANGIDISNGSYADLREDYSATLYSVLVNLRKRARDKRATLGSFEAQEEELRTFLINAWNTIEDTEMHNALQFAQLQAVLNLRDAEPDIEIRKRWMARPFCCPMCEQLNGLEIGIDEYFLVDGQTVTTYDGKQYVYNYKDTEICVAHPNDRCWIEFIIIR